ncbi:S-adenosylmethionine decarboxylase related protein [Metasolibacillus meyeri]|uniref:S-adenosylmethionine decarboxylase related protein n=1 Tax=Metasolibacillus meyeri TaxID=1071052 RepID=A0AAW9NUC5_9BACL|nr:S-adenosylmethionine decarboxylase related protein [Metasolibacillus meyeri]MEC1178651.1 S-adenosylmethionine decarboxylase related protein [Metasolibacillus meyeri]
MNTLNLTILGGDGGVAKALLSLLNNTYQDQKNPIHEKIKNSHIHLVDISQNKMKYYNSYFQNIKNNIFFHKFDFQRKDELINHLMRTNTTIVIDVSTVDSIETIKCCNELGINYINTAIETPSLPKDDFNQGTEILNSYYNFEKVRKNFSNITGVIGSGMNPGIVQWMAIDLMKQSSNEMPRACYIIERDSTFYSKKSKIKKNTIYTSWSTHSFIDEIIKDYPLFVRNHKPYILRKNSIDMNFQVSLGDIQFTGCLVPHEEVLSLGKLYDIELGFIYKFCDYTSEFIKYMVSEKSDFSKINCKVIDPMDAEVEGSDLVGVLLVYKDRERYMYNVTTNKEAFSKYQVSATYFQVACGIYGALSSVILDDLPQGIFYVDELILNTNTSYGEYVSYFMRDFIVGKNAKPDGLLLNRLQKSKSSDVQLYVKEFETLKVKQKII